MEKMLSSGPSGLCMNFLSIKQEREETNNRMEHRQSRSEQRDDHGGGRGFPCLFSLPYKPSHPPPARPSPLFSLSGSLHPFPSLPPLPPSFLLSPTIKQIWRLVTSQWIFTSTGEFIFGILLLYIFRSFERRYGSSKFAVFCLSFPSSLPLFSLLSSLFSLLSSLFSSLISAFPFLA